MEGGGECPGACCPPLSPASPCSAPPLPVEAQVDPVVVGAEVLSPPIPIEREVVAEAASGVPIAGGLVEPLPHLPSEAADTEEVSETRDRAVSEEGAASLLHLLADEEEATVGTSDGGDGFKKAAAVAAPVLTDDLREKIVRQVEYYFSDENLPTDQFLLKFVKKSKEGYVPIAVIASFRRMRKLVQDGPLIAAALRTSSQLVVSADGKKVKRLHALPATEIEDTKPCTVVVENLPEDCSTENIQKIFSSAGNIRSISINDPCIKGVSGINKQKIMISSKVHALVEYETAEAAENAVASLNDQRNWRSGMRVELLLKRMEAKRPSDDKIVQKVRSKHRVKSNQKQHAGHGRVPPGSGIEVPNKPPPGPRMPDGTKGFTMGRGKPCVPSGG